MIWKTKIIVFSLILCSIIVLLTLVNHVPYFYISIEIFLIIVIYAVNSKKSSTWKALMINLSAIFLAVGFAEAFCAGWDAFGFSNRVLKERYLLTQKGHYFGIDEVRGYALRINAKISAKKIVEGEIVYDVTYTTNKYGLRVSPRDLNLSSDILKRSDKNVFFFGCSCTFGEGVKDNKTFPYLIEEKSKGNYKSFNMAMEGYGPHQMLRILETGLTDTVTPPKKPSVFIYLAIIEHIERISCKYPYFTWDVYGPKYGLDAHNDAKYVENFNTKLISKIKFIFYNQLAKSRLVLKSFWLRQHLGWNVTQEDKDLMVKIILRSRDIIAQKYNGMFYVLIWPDSMRENSLDYKYIVSELRKHQVNLIEIKDIFAEHESPKDIGGYQIISDGHPNELAYQRIADYMVNYLNINIKK